MALPGNPRRHRKPGFKPGNPSVGAGHARETFSLQPSAFPHQPLNSPLLPHPIRKRLGKIIQGHIHPENLFHHPPDTGIQFIQPRQKPAPVPPVLDIRALFRNGLDQLFLRSARQPHPFLNKRRVRGPHPVHRRMGELVKDRGLVGLVRVHMDGVGFGVIIRLGRGRPRRPVCHKIRLMLINHPRHPHMPHHFFGLGVPIGQVFRRLEAGCGLYLLRVDRLKLHPIIQPRAGCRILHRHNGLAFHQPVDNLPGGIVIGDEKPGVPLDAFLKGPHPVQDIPVAVTRPDQFNPVLPAHHRFLNAPFIRQPDDGPVQHPCRCIRARHGNGVNAHPEVFQDRRQVVGVNHPAKNFLPGIRLDPVNFIGGSGQPVPYRQNSSGNNVMAVRDSLGPGRKVRLPKRLGLVFRDFHPFVGAQIPFGNLPAPPSGVDQPRLPDHIPIGPGAVRQPIHHPDMPAADIPVKSLVVSEPLPPFRLRPSQQPGGIRHIHLHIPGFGAGVRVGVNGPVGRLFHLVPVDGLNPHVQGAVIRMALDNGVHALGKSVKRPVLVVDLHAQNTV